MAQPAPTARQCTAVLTGVLIRPGIPIIESRTADLTAVVNSRETALFESLAGRARTGSSRSRAMPAPRHSATGSTTLPRLLVQMLVHSPGPLGRLRGEWDR
jgi:hypothetical protein